MTITWYEDKTMIIEFNKIPQVGISYPIPLLPNEFNEEIKKQNEIIKKHNDLIIKKPFYNKDDMQVCICYEGEVYKFSINGGYRWDGASIPRVCWRIIGSNTQPEFILPSLLHDTLCENHHYINNNRYLSTLVLDRMLKAAGVGKARRWAMKHSVDNFQKFCGWRSK